MKKFIGILALGILTIANQELLAANASTTQIWFGGEDPVTQKDKHREGPADYMDLFKPDAPWATAASGLSVFKISTQMALRGTDEQLKTIIDGLRSRHIAMSIELGVLVYSDRCGKGTEGFGSPLAVEAVAKRIKSLGGQLDYVSMDEPVIWGHEKKGKNAQGYDYCQYSLEEMVDQAAPRIAILQRYFPNVQIGEIDGINSRCCPKGVDGIIGFLDLLHKKTGVRPAYVHADVAWDTNWQPMLENLAARMRARGIRVGVVCDGDVNATSGQQWVAKSLERYKMVISNPKTKPDDVIFQTWTPWPHRMLPETDSAAWTYAVRQAVIERQKGGGGAQ